MKLLKTNLIYFFINMYILSISVSYLILFNSLYLQHYFSVLYLSFLND